MYALISKEVNPITCYANAGITVGDFVKAVANDDSVTSSGISSFAGNEIKVESADANTDYKTIIGIAGDSATAAGDRLPVYTEGIFIVRASEAIAAGASVQVAEQTSEEQQVESLDSSEADHKIGKALTSASAADAYIVMLLRV